MQYGHVVCRQVAFSAANRRTGRLRRKAVAVGNGVGVSVGGTGVLVGVGGSGVKVGAGPGSGTGVFFSS